VQVTTGTPIALLIENTDQRSKDYSDIKDKFRPGTPTSPTRRNTASATIAAAGARRRARRRCAGRRRRHRPQGPARRHRARRAGADGPARHRPRAWDWDEVGNNPFFCPDAEKAAFYETYLDGIRKSGSSIGAVLEIVAEGVPAGLGAPIYGKLDAEIAGGDDEHQCGQGRRDRRRLRRGGTDRRGERRRDPHGQRRRAAVPVQPRRRHPRRHLDRPGGGRALRGEADLVDPHAAPDHRRPAARPTS
jgi:hypothetical protein